MRVLRLLPLAVAILCALSGTAMADRVKDMASVAGVRANPLVGYGIVMGLAGTGDGNSELTRQSMQSIISRLGLETQLRDLDARNVAAVMVTAELPPFMKPGQTITNREIPLSRRNLVGPWEKKSYQNSCRTTAIMQ